MAPTSFPLFIRKFEDDISDMKKFLSDIIVSNKDLSDVIDGPISSKSSIKSYENTNLLETMKSEKNRQKSFEGKWPLRYISIKNLVDSGFFYLQSEDKVQCAFCGIMLHSWKVGDDPLKEHVMSSPKCTYFLYKSASVVQKIHQSISSYPSEYIPHMSSLATYKPTFPHLCDFSRRLSTYKNWSHPVFRPEELADCGLFYTGVSDIVTCFYCGGSLKDWEPFDVPLIEHSKNYPHCNYLQIIKNRPTQMVKEVTRSNNLIHLNRGQSKKNLVTSEFLKSEIAQRAKEIFPSNLVEEVVLKQFKETGQTFTSLHQLCEKILKHEEQLKIRSKYEPKNEDISIHHEQNGGLKRLKNSEDAKDLLLCKICMDQELGIVFQPCGHLVSCEKCAKKISECPLCRKSITNVVRTYLG